jgi:hypothetical protein
MMLPGLAVDSSKKQQTVIFCMRSKQPNAPLDAANETTQDPNLEN